MLDYRLWLEIHNLREAGFADFRQKLGNFISGRSNQPQQPASQPQSQQSNNNDPQVKGQKFQKLFKDFQNAFSRKIGEGIDKLSPEASAKIYHGLSNIAKAFTFGIRVHMSDVNEILLALHTAKDVNDLVKFETFSNHERVLKFLQQVFEQNPDTWYNPHATSDAERFPPGTAYSEKELKKYGGAWQESPFRSKTPEPQDLQGYTIVDQLLDMFKDSNTNVHLSDLNAFADALYKKAHEQGLNVQMGDLNKLKDLANVM